METNTTKAVQIATPPPKLTLCKGFTLAEGTAHTSRNDMNTFPRPTGEGLRERGFYIVPTARS